MTNPTRPQTPLAHPFGPDLDPRWYFSSAGHRDALGNLLHALRENAPVLVLLGARGVGKSMILHEFCHRLKPNYRTVWLAAPPDSMTEFWRKCAEVLPLEESARRGEAIAGALGEGEVLLIIMDEAHQASVELLSEIMRMCFFSSRQRDRVQFIAAGQLLLAEQLALAEQRFAQPGVPLKMKVFKHVLVDMEPEETVLFIKHHLRLAGLPAEELFEKPALKLITEVCQGRPRAINLVCERSFARARAGAQATVDLKTVRHVLAVGPWEPGDLPLQPGWRAWWHTCWRRLPTWEAIGILLFVVGLTAVVLIWRPLVWPSARAPVVRPPSPNPFEESLPPLDFTPSPVNLLDRPVSQFTDTTLTQGGQDVTPAPGGPSTGGTPIGIPEASKERPVESVISKSGWRATPPPLAPSPSTKPSALAAPELMFTIRVLVTQDLGEAGRLQQHLADQGHNARVMSWTDEEGAWHGVLVGKYADASLARRQALILERDPLIKRTSVIQEPGKLPPPPKKRGAVRWLPFR